MDEVICRFDRKWETTETAAGLGAAYLDETLRLSGVYLNEKTSPEDDVNRSQQDCYKAWRKYKRQRRRLEKKQRKKRKRRQGEVLEIFRDENYCTADRYTDDEEFNQAEDKPSCGYFS